MDRPQGSRQLREEQGLTQKVFVECVALNSGIEALGHIQVSCDMGGNYVLRWCSTKRRGEVSCEFECIREYLSGILVSRSRMWSRRSRTLCDHVLGTHIR